MLNLITYKCSDEIDIIHMYMYESISALFFQCLRIVWNLCTCMSKRIHSEYDKKLDLHVYGLENE